MKVDRMKLVAGLEVAYPALGTNAIIPAFQCFQFAATGTVTVTDGSVIIRTFLEDEANPKLDMFVPAPQFIQLLRSMKDKEVTIEIEGTNVIVKSKRGALKGTFATVGGITPTEIRKVAKPCEAGLKVLMDGFNLMRYHVSHDEATGAYCGIQVKGNRLYATDKFRLASYSLETAPFEGEVVLPKKYVDLLLRNRGKIKSIGLAGIDQVQAMLDDDTTITTVLLAGDYNDLSDLFPDVSTFAFIELSEELRDVLDRHIAFLTNVDLAAKFTEVVVEGSKCSLLSRDEQLGKLEEEVDLIKPVEKKIAFHINPLFWKDVSAEVSAFNYCEGVIVFLTERMSYLCREAEDVVAE